MRKRRDRVHEIVQHVRVRIGLPAARSTAQVQIPRTALLIDRVQREIERLAGFLGEGR